MAKPEAIQPSSLDGYLEVLTKAVFKSGLSLAVVENKWDGFRRAFDEFDVEKVAGYDEDKIEELSQNPEIVRQRAKIEATVENAQVMLDLAEEHGSFEQYLQNTGDFEEMRTDLKKKFARVGDATAHWFLSAVGANVPEYEKRR